MVRGLHAPERHSGKVHALDVLVLEIPIAKLDLRIEIEDLLILTESPASGKMGVYPPRPEAQLRVPNAMGAMIPLNDEAPTAQTPPWCAYPWRVCEECAMRQDVGHASNVVKGRQSQGCPPTGGVAPLPRSTQKSEPSAMPMASTRGDRQRTGSGETPSSGPGWTKVTSLRLPC